MMANLNFYLTLMLRRLHWIVLIFVACSAIGLTLANTLPPVYRSSANLLVEPPQIPTNLAATTVQTTATEELQITQQRLMTRVNLLDIARTENVFEDIGNMTPDEIVQGMRDATMIRTSAGSGQATIMTIGFESDRAEVAANVVNRYVTIILQQSTELRTDIAGTTLEFFETEVERLGNELEKQSARILEFNNANSDALPSTLAFRLSQQGNLQSQIATLQKEIKNLEDQRARLLEIFQNTGAVSPSATPTSTPAQQQLANLENQLSAALAIYSPEHPRVKLLQSQIAQQAEIVREEAGMAQNIEPQSDPTSILDVQIADIDARIGVFKEELKTAEEALAKVNETIERTPAVKVQLDALTRDYQNIQQQYNQAVSGLAQAATGERIELLAKGQRITVVDPATVPNKPAAPNRLLIAGGSMALGLFLGVGLVLGLELLNNSIRRPVEITRNLGITPLATIPYVRTPMEQVTRRAVYTAVFLIFVIGIPAALYAVHTYVVPLDLIYERIASRLRTIL